MRDESYDVTEIERLKAENARLRAAVQMLLDHIVWQEHQKKLAAAEELEAQAEGNGVLASELNVRASELRQEAGEFIEWATARRQQHAALTEPRSGKER